MAKRRDAADGESGGGADEVRIGPQDRLADRLRDRFLVGAIVAGEEEEIGGARCLSL